MHPHIVTGILLPQVYGGFWTLAREEVEMGAMARAPLMGATWGMRIPRRRVHCGR